MKRLFTLLLALVLTFSLAACGGGGGGSSGGTGGSSTPNSSETPPEGYDAEYTIYVNGSDEWTPFPGKSGVGFTLSDDKVISVSDNGTKIEFTGKQVGESVITATLDGTESKALVKVVISGSTKDGEDTEFTGTYKYSPPADNYHIAYTNHLGNSYEYAKIGDNEATVDYNSGWRHFWNVSTGGHSSFYDDKWIEDVLFDFEAFSDDTWQPLDNFEHDIASFYRGMGSLDEKLPYHYVAIENYLGIDCWVFDSKSVNGNYAKYWVDPANGLTLKTTYTDGSTTEITVYDLNYKEWDSAFRPD